MTVPEAGSAMTPEQAILRVIHCLDRAHESGFKSKAFVRALDVVLGRRAGALLARAGTSDVIDAAVVLLASDGDWILTSDPDDLEPLVEAAGLLVDVIPV